MSSPNFRITLTGTAALLMHNSRLANPLDQAAKDIKRITGKQKKTEDDHAEIARLEHLGSMYYDNDIGPYLPGANIWRSLYDAAKKHKMGPRIQEGVLILTDTNPLAYAGDAVRHCDDLWKDERFRLMASVKVQRVRLMRCRPKFDEWRADADGYYDPNVLDYAQLSQIAETAGDLIGVGDWRPRYGKFEVTIEETAAVPTKPKPARRTK